VSVIPNEVRINYLIPFRIKDAQINETVTHPTQRRIINFDDYTVTLFLKKFDRHFILVDARWVSPTAPLVIESAFTFNQQLIENIPNDNVLAVLEHFANEFGAEIRIGDQRGRFIQDASITVPLETVRSEEDYQRMLSQIMRMESNELPRAGRGGVLMHMVQRSRPLGNNLEIQFALVYCINTESYTRYLKTNNLI
jgi:hypothetical protein